MTGRAKTMVVVIAVVALWLLWGRGLGGLRGDAEAVAEAEQKAEAAETAAEAAAAETDARRAEYDRLASGSRQTAEFAVTLPEIAVHEAHPLRRWYEETLMTPAELRVYDHGDSNETVEFGEPRWWTNNASCWVENESSDLAARTFSFADCVSLGGETTAVIGIADVDISLAGWRGDCRLALGWLFSRFAQASSSEGVRRPTGYHLQPWVLPGSFEAQVPNCMNHPDQVEALRQALGVVWGQWPVSAEEYAGGIESGFGDSFVPPPGSDDDDPSVQVSVKFSLLFRPAHPDLCVPDLIGYVDADGAVPENAAECPAAARLDAEAADRAARGPRLSDRVCLPRMPVATAIDGGDDIVARWDPAGWPPAGGQWPATLEDCSVRPVTPNPTAGSADAESADDGS